jgi:hypothetical protein
MHNLLWSHGKPAAWRMPTGPCPLRGGLYAPRPP